MKHCQLCEATARGDEPPRCAFTSKYFNATNWNCGTVNRIRMLAQHPQADRLQIAQGSQDDEHWALLRLPSVLVDQLMDQQAQGPAEVVQDGLALWVSWYKNRGRTSSLLLLSGEGPALAPTEQTVLIIADYYRRLLESLQTTQVVGDY